MKPSELVYWNYIPIEVQMYWSLCKKNRECLNWIQKNPNYFLSRFCYALPWGYKESIESVSLFACRYPVFLTLFLEETILSLLCILVEDQLSMYLWVCFWAFYSVSLICMSVLCRYHAVWIIALQSVLKSGSVMPLTLSYFAQGCFGYLQFFGFTWVFRFFLILVKNALGF